MGSYLWTRLQKEYIDIVGKLSHEFPGGILPVVAGAYLHRACKNKVASYFCIPREHKVRNTFGGSRIIAAALTSAGISKRTNKITHSDTHAFIRVCCPEGEFWCVQGS